MSIMNLLFIIFTVGAVAAPVSKDSNAAIKEFFKDKTKIDNPFELRDPFKSPPSSRKKTLKEDSRGYVVTAPGKFTNIQRNEIETIDDLRVVGVLIGKERRALVTTEKSKEVIILKEGMKIGQDNAELKAILPGGIVLVEKIINVYGQEEYLETVVPISK
jgi:Tfp pilus assembly protein PilP